jgi:hypothetical protein
MNIFKLQVEETLKVTHEIVINTELSFDELNYFINDQAISQCEGIDDCVCLLEEIEGAEIVEITEGDPQVDEIEIIDITEV